MWDRRFGSGTWARHQISDAYKYWFVSLSILFSHCGRSDAYLRLQYIYTHMSCLQLLASSEASSLLLRRAACMHRVQLLPCGCPNARKLHLAIHDDLPRHTHQIHCLDSRVPLLIRPVAEVPKSNAEHSTAYHRTTINSREVVV